MLFIAAGAFRVEALGSDPGASGAFSDCVELQSLSESDFERILTEPKNNLVSQCVALLGTEEVTVEVREDAVAELARVAHVVNQRLENIGARRLHAILERVFEELSFTRPRCTGRRSGSPRLMFRSVCRTSWRTSTSRATSCDQRRLGA